MADALPPFRDDLYGIPQDELEEINARSEPAELAPEESPEVKPVKRYDPVTFAQGIRAAYPGRFDKYKDDYTLAQAVAQTDPRFADKIDFGPQMPPPNGPDQFNEQNPKTAKLEKASETIKKGGEWLGKAYEALTKPLESIPTAFDTVDSSKSGVERYLGAINVPATGIEAGARAGRAVVGGIEKAGQKAQGVIEKVYEPADIAKEGITPGYIGKKAMEALIPGLTAAKDVGSTAGLIIPQDRLGVLGAIVGFTSKSPMIKDGDLPLQPNKADINPKIAEKFKDEKPFKNLGAKARKEAQAMSNQKELDELTAVRSEIADKQAQAKQSLVGDMEFGNDPEMGAAIKTNVAARQKTMRDRLSQASAIVKEQSKEVFAGADNAVQTATKMLSDKRASQIINLPGDKGLQDVMSKFAAMKNGTIIGAKYPYTGRWARLSDLLQAHEDLGQLIKSQVDEFGRAGKSTPKGAELITLRKALAEDIAFAAATEQAKAAGVSRAIPMLKDRWKNYYQTFDNEPISKILKEENPAKVYEIAKASEDSLMKVAKATQGSMYESKSVFKELKAKVLTEVLEGMQSAENPIDYIEGLLKDKSGKEVLTKFLADSDRAALRQMAGTEVLDKDTFVRMGEIEKAIKADRASSFDRRKSKLGPELAQFGERADDKIAQTAWQVAGRYMTPSGLGTLSAGALLTAFNYPIIGAAVAVSKLYAPVFSHLYVNNVSFRKAVNTFASSPSDSTAKALGKAAYAASQANSSRE